MYTRKRARGISGLPPLRGVRHESVCLVMDCAPESSGPGWVPLIVSLLAIFSTPALVTLAALNESQAAVLIPLVIAFLLFGVIGMFGVIAIAPNNSRVLLLFGQYKGQPWFPTCWACSAAIGTPNRWSKPVPKAWRQ